MSKSFIVVGIVLILLSLAIFIYQKKKYYYLGVFGYNDNDKTVLLNISATGRYLINETIFSKKTDKNVSFKIEEGEYQKECGRLIITPLNQICYLYHNLKELLKNNYYLKKNAKTASYELLIKGHEMFLDNHKLHKFKNGKLVSNKQFIRLKSKQK